MQIFDGRTVFFTITASLLDEFIEYEFMDSGSKLPKRQNEDVFAEAITRVEAGEPIETVAASYPAEIQAELRDLLQIVAVAVQIQQVPVPRPALDRREARKQAFLQTASHLRVERTVIAPVATPSIPATAPTLADRWQAIWSAIQAAFTVRTMRLAPMVLVLAFICLSSFSLATFAQEALPGDIAYPMKEWIRYQKLNLSPAAQQAQVLIDNERELQSDIKKVVEKAKRISRADHDLNKAVVKTSGIMIFHEDQGRYFIIGGLQVLKKYQPDANQNQSFKDMAIEGQLAPGKQVILAYQILPIQSNDGGAPIVQGIALQVLEEAPVVPTPVPSNTAVPTYPPAPTINANCEAKPLSGWLPYQVKSGDTLSAIAQRTNTSVSRLMLANCLTSDVIQKAGILLAPPPAPSATPFVPPTPVPTVTPVDTATPVETISAGEPITPVATLDATATAVFTTTEPAIELTLTSIAGTPTASATEVAPTATTEPTTPEPTTPLTPGTATSVATPDSTMSPTATDFPTVTPTTVPVTPSDTPTTMPTSATAVTEEPEITPASANTPTATSTAKVPDVATQTATVVNIPTFTQTPVPTATPLELPTLTATSVPPPTLAPPTPTPMPLPTEAPTVAPLPTSEGAVDGDAVKSAAQPSPVHRPTLIVFTPTPVSGSPLR